MSIDRIADDRTTRWLRWIARVWTTVLVLCGLLVVGGAGWSLVTTGVADPYAAEVVPPIENLPPLLALLAIAGLAIAWRWEGLGGAIAAAFSLALLPLLLIHWPIARDVPRILLAPYGVWAAIATPAALFLICWRRSRRGVGG
jgi:hypothetical protein